MHNASIALDLDIIKQFVSSKEMYLNQPDPNSRMLSEWKRLSPRRQQRCYHFGIYLVMNFPHSFQRTQEFQNIFKCNCKRQKMQFYISLWSAATLYEITKSNNRMSRIYWVESSGDVTMLNRRSIELSCSWIGWKNDWRATITRKQI